MTKGFFVTGTDTGVGKTIVSAAVIRALQSLGAKTGTMKPVESGCARKGDELLPQDGMFLKNIARSDDPITHITPCCLESPLAPLAASELERRAIDLRLIRETFASLSRKYDAFVIEGVGGLMVPILNDYFVTDLAREFGLPLLVVAKPVLGTINHTMLTVTHAMREGLEVAGVIINYCSQPAGTLAEKTNPGILARVLPVPVIGVFPYLEEFDGDTIEKIACEALNLRELNKYLQDRRS